MSNDDLRAKMDAIRHEAAAIVAVAAVRAAANARGPETVYAVVGDTIDRLGARDAFDRLLQGEAAKDPKLVALLTRGLPRA